MNIFKNQNTKGHIRLLAAYSALYAQAKNIMGFRTIISIIVTATGTLLALFLPSSIIVMASVGALWSLISEIILKSMEKNRIKVGALIQEEFDTDLFILPWNFNLSNNKIAPEVIISADRDFKGNRNKLINWYPNTSNAKRPLDVLLCQRSSVVWDYRLRRFYIFLISGLIISLFVIEVIISLALNQSLLTFFLSLFLPTSSLYLIATESIRENNELLGLRQNLEERIAKIYLKTKNNSRILTVKICREIQNDLYRLRSKNALIPNWFYTIFRDKFEADMKLAASILVKK